MVGERYASVEFGEGGGTAAALIDGIIRDPVRGGGGRINVCFKPPQLEQVVLYQHRSPAFPRGTDGCVCVRVR